MTSERKKELIIDILFASRDQETGELVAPPDDIIDRLYEVLDDDYEDN